MDPDQGQEEFIAKDYLVKSGFMGKSCLSFCLSSL